MHDNICTSVIVVITILRMCILYAKGCCDLPYDVIPCGL